MSFIPFSRNLDDILLADGMLLPRLLPEGRQPAVTNIWSFLAFGAEDVNSGRNIEIIDPNTGLIVGRLSSDETVAMASVDHRLAEQIEEQGDESPLKALVVTEDEDRFEKARHDLDQT